MATADGQLAAVRAKEMMSAVAATSTTAVPTEETAVRILTAAASQ